MKKTLQIVPAAVVAIVIAGASSAQDIPLNFLVVGSTGGEVSQGQAVGALTTTNTTTATVASSAARMVVSTTSSTSTN